jgi:hypothetical protein
MDCQSIVVNLIKARGKYRFKPSSQLATSSSVPSLASDLVTPFLLWMIVELKQDNVIDAY